MAKLSSPAVREEDEWRNREDVDRLLRADEVHADPKRLKRAVARIEGTAKRLTKKFGRSGTRSSSR